MTTLDRAIDHITGKTAGGIDRESVMELTDRYPFFTLPAAALLREKGDTLDEGTRERLTQAVAMTSPDQSALYMLLDPSAASHGSFYPDIDTGKVSTESAIDKFLNTYGSTSPEEEEMLNRLIFNPTPDYALMLAKEEEANLPSRDEAPTGSDEARINAFIIKQKQDAGVIAPPDREPSIDIENRHTDAEPQVSADDSPLSESLARIFIKQRHYQRAYEIISQLSLNYPEKSIYFADQLRFLRKLINNRNHKEHSKNR